MEPEFFVTVGMFALGAIITLITFVVIMLTRNRNGSDDNGNIR